MKKKIKVSKALLIVMVATSFLSITTISFLWILNEIKEHKEDLFHIRENSRIEQEAKLKDAVNSAIQYIKFLETTHHHLNKREMQDEAIKWISTIRFGYGGYVFINTYDGQALVFDGQIVNGYKDISKLIDPNGKNLFDPQIKAAKTKDGEFMTYLFKKMDTDIPEPKMSFMKGYPKWNWIISAGDYLNDLTNILKEAEEARFNQFKIQIIKILLVFILATLLIYFARQLISKYIHIEFNRFYNEIEDAIHHSLLIKTENFYSEEFIEIAKKTNFILQAKNHAEEDLIKEKEFTDLSIDTIFDTFYVFNIKTGLPILWNKAFSNTLGYTDEEIKKLKVPNSYFEGKDIETFYTTVDDIIKNGYGNAELEIISKSGNKIPIEYYASLLRDENQEPKHIITIGRDISERRKTEKELSNYRKHLEKLVQERTSELEEKNEDLERFNQLFVGREFRIKELKDKIKELTSNSEE